MKLIDSVALARLRHLSEQRGSSFADQLRIRRNREFIKLAEQTWDKTIPTSEVCHSWSLLMRALLTEAFVESCRLNPLDNDLKVSLFGYGKLGSNELNLSSDVDLLIVSFGDWNHKAWVRTFQSLIAETTSLGFVARVDFDLRPFGRSGPLVPTLAQFEDYFGNYAETWERLAFIRLDSIAGDTALSQEVLSFAQSFSFRKHLDFGMKSSLLEMRQKIFATHWAHRERGEVNIKLDPGGIRDLELFVQTLQAIHGGRKPQFREKMINTVLDRFSDDQVLPQEEADFLKNHYWLLRHEENRLQAFTDQQNHTCHPNFFEQPDLVIQQMEICARIVDSFLGAINKHDRSMPTEPEELDLWIDKQTTHSDSKNRIKELANPAPSHRPLKAMDLHARSKFIYTSISEIVQSTSGQPLEAEKAIDQFLSFVESLKNKTSYYHMLLERDALRNQVTRLCKLSPVLASRLTARPELMDSFFFGQTGKLSVSSDWPELLESLLDYKLLSEIRLGLEVFNKQIATPDLFSELTAVADTITTSVLKKLQIEFGTQLNLLALGKWGALELGFKSDLDFLLLIDHHQTSDFSLPLKVARRWVSHLSQPQKGGTLYNIDSRLKPTALGNTLVVSTQRLIEYLSGESEPWERMAYLRSRIITQSYAESSQIYHACLKKDLSSGDIEKLLSIQFELYANRFSESDIKYCSGGLVDCELAVGTALLVNKVFPLSTQMHKQTQQLTPVHRDWALLFENYSQLRRLEASFDLRYPTWRNKDFNSHFEGLEETRQIKQLLTENQSLLAHLDPRRTKG